MSRYLTPAKIGLLALVELYIEGAVPNNAIIPVLGFISSHLLDRDLVAVSPSPADRWKRADRIIGLVVSVKEFEQVLAPFAAADRVPGRRLWDRFLEKLWGIDSLHGLQEFFDRLPKLLAKTKDELREMAAHGQAPPSGTLLSRNSPFGVFVRRAHVEFARLQFHHTSELWQAFVKYRQPTASHWRKRNPHYGRLSFDSVLMTGEHEWGDHTEALAVAAYGNMLLVGDHDATLPVSSDDIEALLEFQIEQMQKHGDRVPQDIKQKFERLLKDSHVIPSLSHYLSFSDASRAGDYPKSFDYLHRYFDYTMQNRDRLFYQYALMNLAIVQSDFGCHKEAVATMLETVSTARENRDMTCLNFALNWFFHFGRAHPNLVQDLENSSMPGSGKDSLAYLRVKAKETGMWILWSSSLQSEAKVGMASGDSISTAMENMVRSSQLIVERNMKAMMGPQLIMSISLWDRLGLAYMSSMTCEAFLRCHARNSVFEDELKVICRLAGLLAGKGRYEEAFARLESINANSLRTAKSNQYWHFYRGLLKLRRDLHRSNLVSSETLLSQLLQAGPEDLEPDMVFVVDSVHIEALTRRGDFDAAFTKVDRLITQLRDSNRDIALRIRLLLAKANIFDCTGRPEKGFTVAMRAASLAWRARLVSLIWQSMGALANILNGLGEFAAAARLCVAILPRCLETDAAYTAGWLYNILADARVGQAASAGCGGLAESSAAAGRVGGLGRTADLPLHTLQQKKQQQQHRRNEYLIKANDALGYAEKYFAVVEDVQKQCEVLAKKATLMKVMGDDGLAEDYAAKYLLLKREASSRHV
ncbi:anaphase-promoting complex subunit 5-domain-containing protein [Podospora appendiculata]|uniref:Anaphase-promoting complex subunit 5 n=1 Tax=Podospora appendiculata TaxID=314037 RepID=A0AAE1CIQ9_9PEZI|nr:anaphase-promoting complex subunit 5-domain-containing protein [Podospora appendiculata]